MSVSNKDMLQKQLERQGQIFVSETDDSKLMQEILVTCSSLLRVVDTSAPESFSMDAFDGLYAGFLGILSRINSFFAKNGAHFSASQSAALKEMIEKIREAEASKKDLDAELLQTKEKLSKALSGQQLADASLKEAETKLSAARSLDAQARERLEKAQASITLLQQQIRTATEKASKMETDAEKLVDEAAKAKAAYDDIAAYYEQVNRFREGLKEEGIVDVDSFSKRMNDLNTRTNELMADYDRILKSISEDVEALKRKIDEKRKPGVVG